jgi:hypothetical protein
MTKNKDQNDVVGRLADELGDKLHKVSERLGRRYRTEASVALDSEHYLCFRKCGEVWGIEVHLPDGTCQNPWHVPLEMRIRVAEKVPSLIEVLERIEQEKASGLVAAIAVADKVLTELP